MSILNKLKESKKTPFVVKATIELTPEDAKAYEELKNLIDEKDLLTVALENPKNLERRLEANRKEKVAINKKIDLTIAQKEALDELRNKGYSMTEILVVAYENLNLRKSLIAVKSEIGTGTKETTKVEK
ncbi:MAG TPA: hypothetical protein EYG74_00515 [Sulfurimonas autotrophica]|nr:hypothetical protein [Sulfurimonas autotrophica]